MVRRCDGNLLKETKVLSRRSGFTVLEMIAVIGMMSVIFLGVHLRLIRENHVKQVAVRISEDLRKNVLTYVATNAKCSNTSGPVVGNEVIITPSVSATEVGGYTYELRCVLTTNMVYSRVTLPSGNSFFDNELIPLLRGIPGIHVISGSGHVVMYAHMWRVGEIADAGFEKAYLYVN